MGSQRHVYVGAFAHCRSLQELDICPSGAIGVGESGKIEFVDREVDDVALVLEKHGWENAEIVKIKRHGFFFPGFVGKQIAIINHIPTLSYLSVAVSTTLILSQTPTSTPHNTPTPASLVKAPSLTG